MDFFPDEDYMPDQNDSTQALSHVMIHSAWFFFATLILTCSAQLLEGFGQFMRKAKKTVLIFVAGMVQVTSGLVLFLGQINYISMLKSEVGSKLSPESLLSPPRVTYSYGWSFFSLVISFISMESAGIAAMFLYMYIHKLRFHMKAMKSKNQDYKTRINGNPKRKELNGKVVRSGIKSSHKDVRNCNGSLRSSGTHRDAYLDAEMKFNPKHRPLCNSRSRSHPISLRPHYHHQCCSSNPSNVWKPQTGPVI